MGTYKSAQLKRRWLWDAINSQGASGLSYDKEKLISAFCLDHFSTRKTAIEILQAFEDTDKIVCKDGKIYSRVYFNRDLSIREDMFVDEEEPEELLDNLIDNNKNQKGVK